MIKAARDWSERPDDLDDIDCLSSICPKCGNIYDHPDCSCGYTYGDEPEKVDITSQESDVTRVTRVTPSNDAAYSGNKGSGESVTHVTFGGLADTINDADDPRETPPPPGTKEAHKFPDLESRPRWEVYTEWCGPENKFRPGVYYHGMTKGGEQTPPEPIDDYICAPLIVEATTRDREEHSFGMMLRFVNKLGNWREWNMPARMLAGRGSDGLLGELFDMGLYISYEKRSRVPAYINSKIPDKVMWATAQVGWYDNAFVLPHRVIGDDEGEVFFQSETTGQKEYASRGTLEEWREHVASLCAGNHLLVFQVAAAFAGPLLKLCNVDGAGFHLFGSSSCGKSTGSKLAASAWGRPKEYMRSWKATANGLEGAACLYNDGMLILDELNDGDGHEVEQAIYALGNGKGKQRATVTGGAKGVRSWRILTLSNGENTIEDHLAKKGLTAKAGHLVRLLQIPVFGKHGSFDELHGHADGKAFSDAAVGISDRYFGTSGVAYLERLTAAIKAGEDVAATVKRTAALMTDDDLSSQEGRAATSFALVATAGEMATEYGLTGWEPGAAIESAQACFAHWRGHRGKGNTERMQILGAISDYIARYGDARFTSVNDDRQLNGPRSGYWREREHGREWLITSAGMRDAVTGFGAKAIRETLVAAGWIPPLDEKGHLPQQKVRGKNDRYYIVTLPDGGEHGS